MFLMRIYFRVSFWVKGVFCGFVCWFLMWWVFGRFWLINSRICVFWLSGGIFILLRCEWNLIIFGVGILFFFFGICLYFVICGSSNL